MEKAKLTYFSAMALAEPIRILLRYSGKEFIDIRIDGKKWPKLKQDFPFGKLPVLEIDGEILHQSKAICRFLASETDLCGSTPKENLQIDIMVETFEDFRLGVYDFVHPKNEVDKEEAKRKILEDSIPFYFEKFDKIIEKNGGYLANGKMSWADIYFYGYSGTLTGLLKENVFEKYPHIKELFHKIEDIPGIKEWIQDRPKSDI